MTHETVEVLSDWVQLLRSNSIKQLVLITLNLAGILELWVTLGKLVTHLHLCVKFRDPIDLIALIFVLVGRVGLFEEMPLELKLVFEVLFLFNLPKIKVLLNNEVYVGSGLPFPDYAVCVRALILIKVRLILVLCLYFALQEVIFEFVAKVDPIPFNQNL